MILFHPLLYLPQRQMGNPARVRSRVREFDGLNWNGIVLELVLHMSANHFKGSVGPKEEYKFYRSIEATCFSL
jgi:hypothetical protein